MNVSVTIPCRNEKKYIGLCLDSVLASEFPGGNFEILVCDGKSDDGTVEIVKDYAAKFPGKVVYIENPERTTPFALNYGIRNSKGEIKIILGAHAEVDKNYLRNCYELLKSDSELGCVGGILENVYEDDTSESIAMAMSSSFGVGNAHFRTGNKEGEVDTVAFGAYKSEVFEKTGLFDEELIRNQDDEFNFRVIKAGYKILLSKSIRAKYYVRASFKKLFRQYYQYGYWKVFVNRKHKAVTTWRQLIPPLFVAFLFSGAILTIILPFAGWLYLGGLSVYVIASVFSAASKSTGLSRFFKIILAYYILHFSYGAGYLEGIWKFLILNKKPDAKQELLSR
ncbi:glycosyltransferase family 2 protein [soil metagenome]